MAATPCSGIPLGERPQIQTYNQNTDYMYITDTSEPYGQKGKKITPKYIFTGNDTDDLNIKNKAPGKFITIIATNSSLVEIPLIGVQPNDKVVGLGGSFRGLKSTITASSDSVDVMGYLIFSFDTTSGDITLGGFANGVDRQIIFIDKPNTANNLIIVDNSGTATQKIYTPTGSNITFTHRGGAVLRYDVDKWLVISVGI